MEPGGGTQEGDLEPGEGAPMGGAWRGGAHEGDPWGGLEPGGGTRPWRGRAGGRRVPGAPAGTRPTCGEKPQQRWRRRPRGFLHGGVCRGLRPRNPPGLGQHLTPLGSFWGFFQPPVSPQTRRTAPRAAAPAPRQGQALPTKQTCRNNSPGGAGPRAPRTQAGKPGSVPPWAGAPTAAGPAGGAGSLPHAAARPHHLSHLEVPWKCAPGEEAVGCGRGPRQAARARGRRGTHCVKGHLVSLSAWA